MAKFSLIVLDRAQLAASEHAERAELSIILQNVAGILGDGTTTSGDIKSRSGVLCGEWTYEARAK
jgi:hypothetical protein